MEKPKPSPGVAADAQNVLRQTALDAFIHNPFAFRIIGVATVAAGAFIIVGPWLVEVWTDLFTLDYQTGSQEDTLPLFTSEWWHNQWRQNMHPWRNYERQFESKEAISKLYHEQMSFVDSCAGGGKKTKKEVAFVPCCGDSRVVSYLSSLYQRVLALDCSEEATLRQRLTMERMSATESRVSLLTADVFDPTVRLPQGTCDLIYDRQGLSSIPPERRSDYVFLMKRAMAQAGGRMYIEGTHRLVSKTPAASNNRIRGPPFHLDQDDLVKLFPPREGFGVKCDEGALKTFLAMCEKKKECGDLSYATDRRKNASFPMKCAVWRK